MQITVIICSYNRCQYLGRALESVVASQLPESLTWEVLVVDNNSTDRTPELVEDFCRRYPNRIRYFFEPHPGKSFALNSGIRQARGEILAFMDDDVTVEPTWLQNLTATLYSGQWGGAGGRTLLAEAYSPPDWLALQGPYSLGGVLAAQFDLGDEAGELCQAPYGANAAYRREMFEKYGLFRTDLGPSPDSKIPRPNEDTEFGRRLMKAGERLRYEPSAIVHHPVPRERVRKDYFLAWWFDFGRAGIREIPRRPDICGIPRRYISTTKIITTIFIRRTLEWLLAVNPQRRFFCKCYVWMTAGQVIEIDRQWRDKQEQESNTTSS